MFNTDITIYSEIETKIINISIWPQAPFVAALVIPGTLNKKEYLVEEFILKIIKYIKKEYFYDECIKDVINYIIDFIPDQFKKEYYFFMYVCD